MKKLIIFGILLTVLIIGCAPVQEPTTEEPKLEFLEKEVGKVVTSDSAYNYQQNAKDIVFVSVREREEWDEEHIPGAIWIPHSKLKENDEASWALLEELAQTHEYVITYCGAGHRSGFVAAKAQEKGIDNLFNLDGISFWKLKYPTIKGEEVPASELPKSIHLEEAYYYYTTFDDVVFVDVREPESILRTGGGIIKGSKVIPLSELVKRLDELSCDNENVYICEGTYEGGECSASPAAGRILIKRKGCKAGKQKYMLEGYGAWRDAGYPIEQME